MLIRYFHTKNSPLLQKHKEHIHMPALQVMIIGYIHTSKKINAAIPNRQSLISGEYLLTYPESYLPSYDAEPLNTHMLPSYDAEPLNTNMPAFI